MVRESFESEWTQLARRLRARLERRRVPGWLIDDVIQETGLKLFQMWPEVDAERSPWGLTITIANNLIWDEMNRRRSREVPSDIPDHAGRDDVEEVSLARLELARVNRHLQTMSASQRAVLLAEVGAASVDTSSSSDAVKMRRMRARRRLNSLLEGASASCAFLGHEIRNLTRRASDSLRRWNDPTQTPAVSAAAGIFAAAIMFGAPSDIFASIPEGEPRAAAPATAGMKPFSFLAEGRDGGSETLAPGWNNSKPRPRGDNPTPPESTGADVVIGDETTPARGGAGISLIPDDDWEPSAPSCEWDQQNDGVWAHCHADTPVGDLDVGGDAEIDP